MPSHLFPFHPSSPSQPSLQVLCTELCSHPTQDYTPSMASSFTGGSDCKTAWSFASEVIRGPDEVSWLLRCRPVIPGRLRQEALQFETSLGNLARPFQKLKNWTTEDTEYLLLCARPRAPSLEPGDSVTFFKPKIVGAPIALHPCQLLELVFCFVLLPFCSVYDKQLWGI